MQHVYTHFAARLQKNVNVVEEFCKQRLQRKVQSLNENCQVCYLLNILCWSEYREPFYLTADHLNRLRSIQYKVQYILAATNSDVKTGGISNVKKIIIVQQLQ